jgi:hypothetical protein
MRRFGQDKIRCHRSSTRRGVSKSSVLLALRSGAFGRTNSAGHTTNPKTGAQSSEGNQELFIFRMDTETRGRLRDIASLRQTAQAIEGRENG